MTEITYEYRMQFNNDEASCQALQTMAKGGWSLEGHTVADGYHWLILQLKDYSQMSKAGLSHLDMR